MKTPSNILFMAARQIFGTLVLTLGLTLGVHAVEKDVTKPAQGASSKMEMKESAGNIPPEIEQAMKKASQMTDGMEVQKLLAPAALEWLKKEPTAALSWVHQLPSNPFNNLRMYIATMCGENHGKISADWTLEKKAYGSLHKVIDNWARVDPVATSEWCLQAPEGVRHLAFCSLGDGMCYKDPAPALVLYSEMKSKASQEDLRSMAYGIAKGWTWVVPKDATLATAWAMGLKSPEERMSAFFGIGMGWSRYYLLETTAWIKTLKNKEEIRAASCGVVKMLQLGLTEKQKTLGRNTDVEHYKAAYAKEWLDQIPLSDSEKTDILNSPVISMIMPGKPVWPH